MIQLVITPGLWFIFVVTAAFLDMLIGNIIPSANSTLFLLSKFIYKVFKRFFRTDSRRTGFFYLLIVLVIVEIILISLQTFLLDYNIHIYSVVNVFLLIAALYQRKLFLNSKKIEEALQDDDLEEAQTRLPKILQDPETHLRKNEILSEYISYETNAGIEGIEGPIIYMVFGCLTFFITPVLNPVTLVYFYITVCAVNLYLNTEDCTIYFKVPTSNLNYAVNFIPFSLEATSFLYSGGFLGYNYQAASQVFKNQYPNRLILKVPEAIIFRLFSIQSESDNLRPILYEEDILSIAHILLVSEFVLLVLGSFLLFEIDLLKNLLFNY